MAGWDEDEDWTGEPPEGRHSRERADPGHWKMPLWVRLGYGSMMLALLVLVIAIIVSR